MLTISKQKRILKLTFILISILFTKISFAQKTSSKGDVNIDNNGVMRWQKTNKEVKGFGINYSVPFAHAYRSAKRMGIDPKKAIDNDVYHFTRLGFDLYRLHVWDTEISDTLGNIIENEHLDTFDYLLKKLKDNNINYVITPIAFWGNGWPEPDEKTPGFSAKYGKGECLSNPECIKAQYNYLEQFLNHINPYTGVANKDEPNIIAFEVSNEPHHTGDAEQITEFIKKMTDAMRKTGTKKPIFYNMSHAVQYMDNYFNGNVQGGTFQWYPTGLGYGKELWGNLLPNVNDYNMPFDDVIKKHHGAKLVYEFDAADVGKSYIYPAMARSFRTAGIQIATHFAYDPTFLAPNNTEYNTHYMNLNFTPSKALGLKICSEVFHTIPMYSEFGIYPENTSFDDFKVNYENDLAEYNSDEKFFYTNSTNSDVKNEEKLKEIAGFGSSRIIEYDGLGAYFLDKINEGVWRLEVMPDAVWVDNPFGRNSPKKTVAVTKWETHKMSINLKNLGFNFNIEAINIENEFSTIVNNNSFSIKPGTYIISKKGIVKNWNVNDPFKTNKLNDFYAPKSNLNKAWFKHDKKTEVSGNSPLEITIQYISPEKPKEITLIGNAGFNNLFNLKMESNGNYVYKATIPDEKLKKGYLTYNIIVKHNDGSQITYPSGNEGNFYDWDFYNRDSYKITIVPKESPIHLFNAIDDADLLIKEWRPTFKLEPTTNNNEAEYLINLEKLVFIDNENTNAELIYDYSFKHNIINKIEGRKSDLISKNKIIFHGRSLNNKPCKLQIAFVLNDGSSFGKTININTELKNYSININELKPVKTVTLPRPYPSFLPYYLEHNITSGFDINKIESIQFSIGPGIPKNELEDKHGISIISLELK
ncbi:hypothetical protein SAMN05428642_1043 [Flaviramulus basaltis]|uniref:Cellulase (Glycosyl hydrolase family 5) n=1 Tax=Flaviramulus basaltis TaxID=369401 RepID=A0A1K2IPM6_9FLAO|nr:hypothetical protein [Flaviramulus basaltis]SFZ94210.1 hypothetical protein SAMN05428642_1043 [Flaviramulus basaltis]